LSGKKKTAYLPQIDNRFTKNCEKKFLDVVAVEPHGQPGTAS